MRKDKDAMGLAIAEYHKNGVAGRLRVFSPDFDEDEIPVSTLFREADEMPRLELKALELANGHVLDVGAGAGCHSLALQAMGKQVTAIDISPLSVATMRKRGVADAMELDFWRAEGRFNTILMLMNGIGIVGRLGRLPEFFDHVSGLLAEGGQILIDSTDISYLFENEDGVIELPSGDGYYGEMNYQMQYKGTRRDWFGWLYVDFDTLAAVAAECGFAAECIARGEHSDYLARLTPLA